MSLTNLIYNGYVNLKIKLSNGELISINEHNEGLDALMKSICKYLSGNAQGVQDIPRYLDLRKLNNSEYESILRNKINLSGINYEKSAEYGNNWVATFTGAIDYDEFSVTPTESDTYKFYLLSGENNSGVCQELARVNASGSELIRISPGTMGIVTWTLQITNE